MKAKSVVMAATSMMLVLLLEIPTFAQADKKGAYIVNNEVVDFLNSHNVDVTPFMESNTAGDNPYNKEGPSAVFSKAVLYDENILSFKRQVDVYNFSDDQIQKYVKGLLETSPTVINNASTFSTASASYSTNRPNDNGIGYEVKSNTSGYNEETAYAVIPSAYRTTNTSGYLFYTVSGSDGWGIDVGLWYGGGTGGDGWRGVYNSPDLGQNATTGVIGALTAGKQIYTIAHVRTDGYLEFKALDAANFSIVYVDFIYYVGNHIWTTNGIFNRQITLCNGDKIFSNGSYMRNAKFSQAYLYSNTGYAPETPTNSDSVRHGAFGTNSTNVNQVTVNSYAMWGSEDVSINF
jgi:hypothetical protein